MSILRVQMLSVVLASAAYAQTPELVDVLNWKGTIGGGGRMTASDLPTQIPGAVIEIDYTASFSANVELARVQDDPPIWQGRMTGSTTTIHYSETVTAGDCVVTITADATGPIPVPSTGGGATLEFNGNRGFRVSIAQFSIPATFTSRTVCSTTAFTETDDANLFVPDSTPTLSFVTSGSSLVGEGRAVNEIGSSSLIPGNRFAPWTVSASLTPDNTERLELFIENTDAYRQWRPDTTPDAKRGNPLALTASVVSSTGNAPQTAVESFTWELVGTSREPGVTSNYPVRANDTTFDLELEPDTDSFVVISADKQRVERAVQSGFTDSIRVVPFDWGGWSELRVVARLTDGRELVGKLRGTNEDHVRIPKRGANSKIADVWKMARQMSASDDDDDNESKPAGDGNDGDGLTLYEEYRGFYEGLQHSEGDPKTKDFFVRNKAMFAAIAGLEHFRIISGLNVHRRLTDTQLGDDRVVNANTRGGAHLIDQHAVIIEVKAGLRDRSYTLRLGNPRISERIELIETWDTMDFEFLYHHVAHELGHSVNVAHHGEGDFEPVWSIVGSALDGGVLYETRGAITNQITVRNESDDDMTEAIVFFISQDPPANGGRRKVWVGAQRGQHSGNEDCVMRYAAAKYAASATEPRTRYMFNEPEFVGLGLCASGVGTGVNAPARSPQSRYGEARAGLGDCRHQLLVNDAVVPPVR